ncbi:MAG TPA: hypothetical protein VGX95_04125 [Xanthobacteraceae bacterium]|jgi:hypothetical protein|nr:hypothetical protein [Xanthobacteraceae bacterium]
MLRLLTGKRLIVRPNLTQNFRARLYHEKAARWKALWPELSILEPPSA